MEYNVEQVAELTVQLQEMVAQYVLGGVVARRTGGAARPTPAPRAAWHGG